MPGVATLTWQVTPDAAIMIAPTAISAGVTLVAWRQRRVAGGKPLAVLMPAIMIFSLTAGLASAYSHGVRLAGAVILLRRARRMFALWLRPA